MVRRFMQHNPKAYLFDIIKACDLIIGYTKGFDSTSYLQDRMLRDAVERNFITIGEALNRLKTEDHEMFVQIPDSNKIIAFRNVVVHAYDVIENELVWDVVQEEIVQLKEKCQKLLNAE